MSPATATEPDLRVADWAGKWERARLGELRVEYKKIGGRHVGSNLIPGRAWIDSYDQA